MNLSYYATQDLNPEYVERLRVAVRVAFPVKGCKLVPVSNPAKAQLILDPSFDSDTELLAMFLHFASLVPWPGRDSETLYFDIETHNAEKIWDMSPREFFRMGQYAWGIEGEAHVTYDYDEMIETIRSAYGLVAHNGHPFDFTWALGDEALEWAREGRLFDTMVYGNLAYPAPFMFKDRNGREHFMEMAGQNKVVPHTMKWLGLDNLCYQLGTGGKVGSLRELAIKYNPPKTPVADLDYGLIDPSDEEFVDYGKGDITALQGVTHGLLMQRPISDYDWREQLCAAINAQISRNGFCVDVPMAQERVRVLEDRKTEIMAWLVKEFDFPTEGKAPWSSKVGKAAILEALASFGVVPNKDEGWPFGKTGPSLGGKVLLEFCKDTDAEDLAQALATLMGQRPLAAQALQYTHSDGKVHPSIVGFQLSGRLSVTEPSLATWTARGDGSEEKAYFVADPECLLLECDLSNADARVVAALSGDREFAKRFEGGIDAHELTGRFMFGDALYDSDPKAFRFKSKACIAEGELVLTSMGLVPIEKVTDSMRLWDGVDWVTHGGVLYQGEREVIEYDGLRATEDHVVFAWDKGERVEIPFGVAANRSLPLVQTEIGGSAVRTSEDHISYLLGVYTKTPLRVGKVRRLRAKRVGSFGESATKFDKRLSNVHQQRKVALPVLVTSTADRRKATLREPQETRLRHLRRSGYPVRLRKRPRSCAVYLRKLFTSRPRVDHRSNRPQRALRTRQSQNGFYARTAVEQTLYCFERVRPTVLALRKKCRGSFAVQGFDPRRNYRACSKVSRGKMQGLEKHSATARIYDIFSAGPRSRFTVSGRLVHNCSHAFNYGAGSKKLAGTARVELEHAEKFVDFMRTSYPKLIAWQERVRREGEKGYVVNAWGRRMPVDEGRAYTVSPALHGQSGTREILFDGLIALPDEILRMIKVTVHDAVVLSVPRERVGEVQQQVIACLSTTLNGIEFPLSVGKPALNWFEAGHE